MIGDKSIGKMSVAQAVTAAAASTDYADLKAAGDFVGDDLYLLVQCNENAAAAGAATVDFKVQTANQSDFSDATVLASTGAIAKTALLANKIVATLQIPNKGVKRYLRMYYDVATGPLTAGKFTTMLVTDIYRDF